mmetsp:Transcript_24049/g.58071  ORF Transcript_24049/g.58071 Transcript_24049/m.58071 type:complete len:137 (-) Transcript_24049:692-1102(-)
MIPSRSCNVSNDSIVPTAAIVMAYGKMMLNVSRGEFTNGVQTDSGSPILGRTESPPLKVSAPATSAKVFTGHLNNRAMAAEITTPPNVGGTTLVASTFSCSLGMPKRTKAMVNRAQPYVALPSLLTSDRNLPADLK